MLDQGEARPPINLATFQNQGLDLGNGRIYREVFGPQGWELFKAYGRQEGTGGFDPNGINNDVTARFGMMTGLHESTSQGVFLDHWVTQIEQAKRVIERAIKTIAPHREELLQPLSNPFYSPVEVIRVLGTPTAPEGADFKGVDPELKHTAATLLLLASISGEIAVTMPSNRFLVKAGEMTAHFEKTLFKGNNEGQTTRVTLYSDHDLGTNHLMQHGRVLGEMPKGSRRFEHVVKARQTHEGVQFFYDGGLKSPDSSALKVLRYGDLAGEVPEGDLTKPLTDYVRFRFVSIDSNQASVESLKTSVLAALETFPGGIKELTVKNLNEKNKGSSGSVEMLRLTGTMPYFDFRIVELMFMTHRGLVAQYREAGHPDPKTGVRDGQGHAVYDVRRTASVGKNVLFPEPVFGFSLDADIAEASESATRKLMTEGLIAENRGFGLN